MTTPRQNDPWQDPAPVCQGEVVRGLPKLLHASHLALVGGVGANATWVAQLLSPFLSHLFLYIAHVAHHYIEDSHSRRQANACVARLLLCWAVHRTGESTEGKEQSAG